MLRGVSVSVHAVSRTEAERMCGCFWVCVFVGASLMLFAAHANADVPDLRLRLLLLLL